MRKDAERIDMTTAANNADLRPTTFDQFIGQPKPKRVLQILVQAARKRGSCVPHLLLSGPPGLGKTTLARIVAREMQSRLLEIVASHLQSPDELAHHLNGIREGDILFIDEIHGLPRAVEECLYSAMEDFQIAVPQQGFDSFMKNLGATPKTATVRMREIPRFTCIGATTLAGLVSDPLRSRFVQTLNLEPYSEADLTRIVLNAAAGIGFELTAVVAAGIAGRSRQTARVAIGHLRWLAEYCTATGCPADLAALDAAFDLKDVDAEGLTKLDRRYLSVLVDAGCPLGLSTLAASLGESRETLEQAVEPFLIRKGYVRKGSRGRIALAKAFDKADREAAA